MKREFVELNRLLIPTSISTGRTEPDSYLYAFEASRDPQKYSWDRVLEEKASIVLGGAGSGKTSEVLFLTKKLNREGKQAFCLKVRELAETGLDEAFHPKAQGTLSDFNSWLKRSSPGFFFLDALDEATLPNAMNQRALQRAINNLANRLGRHRQRITIVLTTRGSEWFDETDKDIIERFTDSESTEGSRDNAKVSVSVFRLGALTEAQVKKLAESRNIDGNDFIKGINSAKASNLVLTPYDCHNVLDIWEDSLCLGQNPTRKLQSRQTIIELALDRFFLQAETNQKRSLLEFKLARSAVEKLAAACALSNIRDFALLPGIPDTLNAESILADGTGIWTQQSVRQLLAFACFENEIENCVRFHHRETQDYLAACFFDRAISERSGSLEPIHPLISTFEECKFIPKELRNLFGWLATLNPTVRRFVTDVEPSLLVEAGDPSCLMIDERCKALQSHALRYEDRRYRGEHFYQIDLDLFAADGLDQCAGKLLEEATSPELRTHLLHLVEAGNYTSLFPDLEQIAVSNDQSFRTRSEAIRTVLKFKPQPDLTKIADQLSNDIRSIDQSGIADGIEWNLFLSTSLELLVAAGNLPDEVSSLLERIQREPKNFGSSTPTQLARLCKRMPDARLVWLHKCVELIMVERRQSQEREPVISDRFRLLLPLLAACVECCLDESEFTEFDDAFCTACELLCSIKSGSGILHFGTDLETVAQKIASNSLLVQRLVTHKSQVFENPVKSAWLLVRSLTLHHYNAEVPLIQRNTIKLMLSSAETENDIATTQMLAAVAQQALNDITEYGRPNQREWKKLIERTEALLPKNNSNSIGRQIILKIRRFFEPYKWKNRWRNFVGRLHERQVHFANRLKFIRDASKIRSGHTPGYYLWTYKTAKFHDNCEWSEWLIERYGKGIANDFETGVREFWKNEEDVASWNESGLLSEVAQIGVELSLATGDSLSPEEARCGIILGLRSFNSVPDWFEKIAKQHTSQLETILHPKIDDALSVPENEHAHSLLSLILYSDSQTLSSAAATYLQDLVFGGSECSNANLKCCLSIISRNGPISTHYVELIRDLTRSAIDETELATALIWKTYLSISIPENSELMRAVDRSIEYQLERLWIWLHFMCVWFPESAIDEINVFFEGTGLSENYPAIKFLAFWAREDRYAGTSNKALPFRSSVPLLKRLIEATYLVAPPETDVRHEDSYSPGIRDNAESARRLFTEILVDNRNTEASAAIVELSESSELLLWKDSFLYQGDRLKANAAKRQLISPEQINQTISDFAALPQSRKQFFRFVETVVSKLLDQFHNSDFDEAKGYRKKKPSETNSRDEQDFRNWLAARLHEANPSVFIVTREGEVAEANRYDIRLTARDPSLGNISIEIKLADRKHWTAEVLADTVKSQLHDQYMRQHESHSGILILVNCTGEQFSKPYGATTLQFDDVLKLARTKATSLSSDSKFVSVLGISL